MKIHFSGIGGIGMSALARYYLFKNHQVTGSDSTKSHITEELIQEGVTWISHKSPIPEDTTRLIYTEALMNDNIQLSSAKSLGVKSFSYFEALGEISKSLKTIAVCGTHGKSTCTAMIGRALSQVFDPLVIVGTLVKEFGQRNIYLSHNVPDYFVVEACEYRKSFLHLSPYVVLLLNCEYDHADYYKTPQDYYYAFEEFVQKIPKDGFLIANMEDDNVKKIVKKAECQIIPVEFSKITQPHEPKVQGLHNIFNAEISFITCKELLKTFYAQVNDYEKELLSNKYSHSSYEESILTISQAIKSFTGTWRRFEVLGEKNDILFIDDYAHHPTEISVVLKTLLQDYNDRRIIIVFQPHQYSRTYVLFNDFIQSFKVLQKVSHKIFITNIYEARDTKEDKEKISGKKFVESLESSGLCAQFSGDYMSTVKILRSQVKKNDIVITMGAGPVNTVNLQLLDM